VKRGTVKKGKGVTGEKGKGERIKRLSVGVVFELGRIWNITWK
jgi:hypothetical protein